MTFDSAAADQPLVQVSDAARDLVLAYRGHSDKPNPERLAMWVEITGVSGSGFSYDMYLKSVDDAAPDDAVVTTADGLHVVIPAGSVDQMQGSTIDLSDSPGGGGLFVRNPQSPSPAVGGATAGQATAAPSGPVAERVIQVLDHQINPAIAAHGGHAELVAVEDDVAYLRLSGGCQGCGMASVTLSQGIEVALRDNVPEISRVVDVTDHAAGANPYYEAAKK
ncbi:MAG: NifU family protein [Chloroflexota bacterium]|nr:NifU family protein [Chloroflexota bacterium]MDE2921049.1 NifU family protein [Chloroflexota bacterium]